MDALLQVKNLKKYFPITKGGLFRKDTSLLKAVDDVSFDVLKGETLGLVGESGCGKSTTGRCILRLLEPTGGEVKFAGQDIRGLDPGAMRKVRKDMQIVFQDPYASLNPRMKIKDIVMEPILLHGIASGQEARDRVARLLEVVGLAGYHADRYAHEFSGGQRQRIGIARALAVEPKLVVCDEPVSALDVSIQAQVINLLEDLQQEFGLTYLFIAHDLSVVEHISDRVAVMYLGRIVEMASYKELYQNPQHPYTKALLSAIPVPNPKLKRERIMLKGDVVSPIDPPPGCNFSSRCPYAEPRCSTETPVLQEYGADHRVACHLV
ncbi:MAG TPA: dipeptide ABC transporter ATP-binding protein [Bacillota bacterium]|nr:dipeptide ABC transporter ATP-binding protein [Bacillota bacterium]